MDGAKEDLERQVGCGQQEEKTDDEAKIAHGEQAASVTAGVTALVVVPSSGVLVSSSEDGFLRLWGDCSCRRRLVTFLLVLQRRCSCSHSYLYTANVLSIFSWTRSWRTLGCLNVFNGHTAAVTSLIALSDGKSFASGSDDKTVRIWRRAAYARMFSVDTRGQ